MLLSCGIVAFVIPITDRYFPTFSMVSDRDVLTVVLMLILNGIVPMLLHDISDTPRLRVT